MSGGKLRRRHRHDGAVEPLKEKKKKKKKNIQKDKSIKTQAYNLSVAFIETATKFCYGIFPALKVMENSV